MRDFPSMRQALWSKRGDTLVTRTYLTILLSVALPAQAMTFQTRMEDVRWQVAGDQFACRLSQSVAGYGEATFVRRAGERAAFELKAWDNPMRPGTAQIFNDPPPWRPGSAAQPVGQGVVAPGSQAMLLPFEQAGRMLAGLASGLQPTIMRSSAAGSESVRVVVSSVGYQQAWNDYQACVSKLLPISAAQAEQSNISFRSGGSVLSDEAKGMLDAILQYLQAADEVSEIVLDGHSDNQGNRLDNRELSRQRALAVRDYLMAQGVEESLFSMRFHGDRYPIASNRTAEGRAANRRVMVRLQYN
ncbi:flagellar protein MotY [Halopseudomonas maritima]|uniref:flagellar protein MotY n=1 Tax=Halopseudomonas maritima TaxID=2918528 RepID=UPI001EEBFFDC|nr:OmpA family protein [Halopseudomonas maritima]UJJ31716.1 OmpA family protein [Halopseudomonas maritima]